jgi:hypothetical protein
MVGLKERGRVGRHCWGKVMVKLCYFRVGGWGSVKCCEIGWIAVKMGNIFRM